MLDVIFILTHCTKNILQSAQPDDGYLRVETCSC